MRLILICLIFISSCKNEEANWEKREKFETYIRLVQPSNAPPPLSAHCEFIEYANELCQPIVNPLD